MRAIPGNTPQLRLVAGAGQAAIEVQRRWFCGYCATPAPDGVLVLPHARVCGSCGLGLLLEARIDLVPGSDDAFLVLDSRLLVQAVSREAEERLGITEHSWVDQPVAELLVLADAEAGVSTSLSELVLEAGGGDQLLHAYVRPRDTFGVRLRARIGVCGPPRAALIVLEGPPPRSLRAL